jgi:hypothetical protein
MADRGDVLRLKRRLGFRPPSLAALDELLRLVLGLD